jgi:subtilisin family serine protease
VSRFSNSLLAALLCVLAPVSLGAEGNSSSPSGARVDESVWEALRTDGRAICFINCRGLDAVARGGARGGRSDSAADGVVRELAHSSGALLCHRFRRIPSLLYEITDASTIEALERLDAVESIVLDQRGGGFLEESLPGIGVSVAHDLALRGDGTVVALLDTGIDRSHPALRDAVVHEQHFLRQTADTGPGASDDHGHGTHVAGVLASRGVNAPIGVAPESELVVIKVLDAENRGWISDWTAGVEYVIELDATDNGIDIDVINMSFGTDTLHQGSCDTAVSPFFAACRRAAEQGITLVAASGNGSSLDSLPVPACYSPVISVGSVWDTALDRISSFTNRSSELALLAPGEPITSTGIHGGTSVFRGTSQASPHVAGLACLLREAGVVESGEILEILVQTGVETFDTLSQRAYRVVDASGAVAVAQAPRASDLVCLEQGGGMTVTWRGGKDVDHYRFVVERAEETIVEEELTGAERSFAFPLQEPGVIRVSLQPFDRGGQGGLTLVCEADARLLEPRFVRGECDLQGDLIVTDPLFLARFLFSGGERPECLDACNADGDRFLSVTDVIYVLNYLFLGGAAPPAPSQNCGVAGPRDRLGCDRSYCP